ncbi:hypothetical protein IQ277_24530 [Nostocales cyanobacterium LEGE 12452]|nr:hypothetical protein [Nostocales cyanobacterium LEGE 12452]
MPKKKNTLSLESIEKLKEIKREPESSPKVLQFKFEPFCNLEEIGKQKAIKRQLKLEEKKLEASNLEKKKLIPIFYEAA